MNPRLAHIEPPAAIAIADRVRALKASGITVAAALIYSGVGNLCSPLLNILKPLLPKDWQKI